MQFGPEAVCSARKNRIGSEFIICRDEAYCWAQNSKFDERLLFLLLTDIGLCNAEAYVLFEGGRDIEVVKVCRISRPVTRVYNRERLCYDNRIVRERRIG